ncbi:hypothetical protein Tco_1259164 [Tanacetum coccineum]
MTISSGLMPPFSPFLFRGTIINVEEGSPSYTAEFNVEVCDYLADNPTPDRVVPLAGVNDQGNQNEVVQDEGIHVVNEKSGDAAVADQFGQSDHVVHVRGIDIVGDDEVQAIVADKPKRVRKKRKAADGAGSSGLPPKKLKEDHGSTLPVEVGIKAVATLSFITSYVSLTPEREGGGHIDSITGPNLRTQRATMLQMMKLLLFSVAWTMNNYLLNLMSERPIRHALALKLGCGWSMKLGEAEAEEAIRLRGQVATVEAAEAARANELNVLKEQNSALEEEKCTLEIKVAALEFADATKVAELASLTAQVAKLTKALSEMGLSCDELSIKASFLEVEKDRLVGQVSSLEGICYGLHDEVMGYKLFKEQIEVVQDEQVKVLSDKVAGLEVDLIGMDLHLDEVFYPRYLTTIVGRRWILSRGLRLVVMKCIQSPEYLVTLGGAIGRVVDKGMYGGLAASINHGKAGRGLANVATYNPSAQADYISVVNALYVVDFPLLAQL